MVLKINKWKNRWTLVVRTAIGYPYYKGSPCVTTEIITDKFDVLRGRLLGNHNDFPYKASAAVQALKVCPVRPRVLSSWGITLLEKLRAADESWMLETALSSSVQLIWLKLRKNVGEVRRRRQDF